MTNLRALSTCLLTVAAACGSPARGLAVAASQGVRRKREVIVGGFPIVRAGAVLACYLVVGSFVSPAGAELSGVPEAVSPAAGAGEALVELRCPSFSWGGVEGAGGYELVVFGVSDGDVEGAAEPRVVSQARLSQGARSWTPSLGRCLERGGRYAWSVRALTDGGEGEWSAPALFRVTAGPSMDDVEAAMETLRRHLGERQAEGDTPERPAEALDPAIAPSDERLRERLAAAREQRADGGEESTTRMEASAEAAIAALLEGADAPMQAALAEAPVLGSPSLSVSSDIALGAASNLFKDGDAFLWDDASGNTVLGRDALAAATGTATLNTAVGRGALQSTTEGSLNTASGFRALRSNATGYQNTASGTFALYFNTTGGRNTATGRGALQSNTTGFLNTASGDAALVLNTEGSRNTASGSQALRSNTTGNRNTASGYQALFSNTTGKGNTASGVEALRSNTAGFNNTASGSRALFSNDMGEHNAALGNLALHNNTTGSFNTAIGQGAGFNWTTGHNNIAVGRGALGGTAESGVIRIGGNDLQTETFIEGISGTTVSGVEVMITSDDQLGVATSSARFKHDIHELEGFSDRLLGLRPVSFRYKDEASASSAEAAPHPIEYGLIAEEVAETFPELVVYDDEGQPFTVRYRALAPLLLGELQREHERNDDQERHLDELRARLAVLEGSDPPAPKRKPWWRRGGSDEGSP